MRVIEESRTSRAAIWCQRFAIFLIPYFAVVVLLYRFAKMETMQLFVMIAIGLIIAVVALILGIRAIGELWSKGYRGGSYAARGLFIAILVLLPFVYQGILAAQYPLANDVSTNPFDPPSYLSADIKRQQLAEDGMNLVITYSDDYAQKIVTAYPQLQPRRYPASPERVYEAISAIIQENDWPVTGTSGVPELPQSNGDSSQETETSTEALEDNEALLDDIEVEFLQRTPFFGFENDVVVRIMSEDQNTLVDMRVSSRWGKHDFGYNAGFIEKFLGQLDTALLGIAGEG
ncbi:MAG: DUF1499 domain-containing protein [Pseudomonadota bacterium]